jgi:hypothetical protein
MIRHIEGTKAGDRVTRNTPVGSTFTEPAIPTRILVVNINGPIVQGVHEGGTAWVILGFSDYASGVNFVITPGPLPWRHRLWNWIAERWGR